MVEARIVGQALSICLPFLNYLEQTETIFKPQCNIFVYAIFKQFFLDNLQYLLNNTYTFIFINNY